MVSLRQQKVMHAYAFLFEKQKQAFKKLEKMAHYHLHVKNGVNESSSGTRGANHHAYINREGKYEKRGDLEITSSGNLPSWAKDANHFWQSADKYERQNGRVYKELEISLPRELNAEQRAELVEQFVQYNCRDFLTYSYAIHNPIASDGMHNPHVHIMFSERRLDHIERTEETHFKRYNPKNPENGGARKDRTYTSRSYVFDVRKEWTNHVNDYCAKHNLETRIDHRSYKDQGIDLASQNFRAEYLSSHSYAINGNVAEIKRQNGETIIERPSEAIKVLTANQSVFTQNELDRFLSAHTDGEQQYLKALESVMNSAELAVLHDKNEAVFSSKEIVNLEHSISVLIYNANEESRHVKPIDLTDKLPMNAIEVIADRTFNDEQHKAFLTLTSSDRISLVNGSAGTGKSYVLSAVSEAYTKSNYNVHGIALQAITANAIAEDCKIPSSTIASFIARYESGNIEINNKSVLILDEAGMVGTRDMQQLLMIAEKHDAQIKMVGDSYQLNAVMAGSTFKFIQENLDEKNQSKLVDIQRQKGSEHSQLMITASKHLSNHNVSDALNIYKSMDMVHEHASNDVAIYNVVQDWMNDQSKNKLMLAHSNSNVNDLNLLARDMMLKAGKLGQENQDILTQQGNLNFAVGEKVVFKKNDKGIGVVNGETAEVLGFTYNKEGKLDRIIFEKQNNDIVSINPNDYNNIKYGYANTIHSSQGMTVDSAHVLVSEHMNANLTYVAMTRHKEKLNVHYNKMDFSTNEKVQVKNKDGSLSYNHNREPVMREVGSYENLTQVLSRSESKKFTTDYTVVEAKEKMVKGYINDHRLHISDKANLYGVNKDFAQLAGEQRTFTREEIINEVRADLRSRALLGQDIINVNGKNPIAKGEEIKLIQPLEYKTGFFKSQKISNGTELKVLNVYTENNKAILEVRHQDKEYKVPLDKIEFEYSDKYFNEYKQNTKARFDARNNSEVYSRMRKELTSQKENAPSQNKNTPLQRMQYNKAYEQNQAIARSKNSPDHGLSL